jgi:mono/diheme cytochrome c family protein
MVLKNTILVAFVATMLVACGGPHQKPASNANGAAPDGAALYSVKCAICHGDDGAKETAGAKNLQVSVLSKEEVVAQVRYGRGAMPPQNGVLSDAEIEAVTNYAIALRKH